MPPTLITTMLMMMILLVHPILITMILSSQTPKIPIFIDKTQYILQKRPQRQKSIKNITDSSDSDAKIAVDDDAADAPYTVNDDAGSKNSINPNIN